VLFLVGGPSHIDTWDPKPDAMAEVRGPFRPIRTTVPGIHLCENFPRMAAMADRFALVRSVYHGEAAIHETGQQLLQTGKLGRGDLEYPHYGATISHLRGRARQGHPPFVVVPGPIANTGVNLDHGQGAGFLGADHNPTFLGVAAAPCANQTPESVAPCTEERLTAPPRALQPRPLAAHDQGQEHLRVRKPYGSSTFGQSCLLARRLIEQGARLVTVNMFDTVYNRITWDCHAHGGVLGTTLDDYRTTLCPMFDEAYTALLEDLSQRGMLETTLVVAMGEFGRTPRLNARGGRDHWPGVWTILFAGGGIRGGQVIGASDRTGAEPQDRPVTPAEVAATVYHALGVPADTRLPAKDGRLVPLIDAAPVHELF
jgi:hypothetical protein